jgi:hypothetical protein
MADDFEMLGLLSAMDTAKRSVDSFVYQPWGRTVSGMM